MPRALVVVPGKLERLSGGNLYDRVVIGALDEARWEVAVVGPGDAAGQADLVILDSLAFPFGAPATDAPILALAHQVPGEAAGGEADPAEREALGAATAVVTVAGWLAERLRELTDAPVEVIPPGRDGSWASEGTADHADSVLCVGNAVPGKGLPQAIEAFATAGIDDGTLVVAGDMTWDAAEARLVERAAARAGDRVRLVGRLAPDALADRYRRARLLLTASRYEGWPIAVAEAMASGVPVVGFDVPGVRELVRQSVDGLLVPAGIVEALSRATSILWKERERARAMGAAARERAMGWPTWEETGRRFADTAARVAGVEPEH